jgi:hypothetical protein
MHCRHEAHAACETSPQIWGSRRSYIYTTENSKALVGQFQASPPVVTDNAVLNPEFTVNVMECSSGDSDFAYLVDVTLTGTIRDFDALFGAGLSVFRGTRDCSNDAIKADLPDPPANVPGPVPVSLLAAGMGGMHAAPTQKDVPLRRECSGAPDFFFPIQCCLHNHVQVGILRLPIKQLRELSRFGDHRCEVTWTPIRRFHGQKIACCALHGRYDFTNRIAAPVSTVQQQRCAVLP